MQDEAARRVSKVVQAMDVPIIFSQLEKDASRLGVSLVMSLMPVYISDIVLHSERRYSVSIGGPRGVVPIPDT